jgi:RNA 3'-terminal phosphate cyclase (ATP)
MLGSSGLGKKTATGTEVGRDAAEGLIGDLEGCGCVDQHLQDQLILWMALAQGRSRVG